MSTPIQSKYKVKLFNVNFTEFDNLITNVLAKIDHQDVQLDDVIDYLHTCFNVYVVVNQQQLRSFANINDKYTPFYERRVTSFKLPVFFKDAIREMARPMITPKSQIYIPNVIECRDFKSDWSKFIPKTSVLVKIPQIFAGMKLSKLEIEEINPVMLGLYHEEANLVSTPQKLPPYRIKALSILKHIRFQQYRLITNHQDSLILDRGNGQDPELVINVNDIFLNTDLTCGFSVYSNNKRVRINSQALNCLPVERYHVPEVLATARFPTEERFLKMVEPSPSQSNYILSRLERKHVISKKPQTSRRVSSGIDTLRVTKMVKPA